MLRTKLELIAHIRSILAEERMLDFQNEVLMSYLTADEFREFAKPDADLSGVKTIPYTEKQVLEDMREYMEFAWGKVRDHRGLSAGRSVNKMQAWLWILGDTELEAFAAADHNYSQYGAPILAKISERYTFAIPPDAEIKRMSEGKPCREGCDEGCGRGFTFSKGN